MASNPQHVPQIVTDITLRHYSALSDEKTAAAFLVRSERYLRDWNSFRALPIDAQEAVQDANGSGHIKDSVDVRYLDLDPAPLEARTFGTWKEEVQRCDARTSLHNVRDDFLPTHFQLLRWIDPSTTPWHMPDGAPIFWRHTVPVFVQFAVDKATSAAGRVEIKQAKSRHTDVWAPSLLRGKPDVQADEELQRHSQVVVVFNLLDSIKTQVNFAAHALEDIQNRFQRIHDVVPETTAGNKQTGYGTGRYAVFLEALDLNDTGYIQQELSDWTRIKLRTLTDRIAKGKAMVEGDKWREILGLLD